MKNTTLILTVIVSSLFFVSKPVCSQPKPGDYFRDYTWTTPDGEGNSQFLRIGGKFDYRIQPEDYPDLKLNREKIFINHSIDLNNAIKTEIVIEKVLCHDGTKNLRIALNGGKQYIFPESPAIPEPQEFFMHHFCSTLELPLTEFKQGNENYFSLEVDSIHPWNWPQNLIYGVICRVYYKNPDQAHDFKINANQLDDEKIQVSIVGINKNDIKSVDFIAKYDGPDIEGDGVYDDWHYCYFRGKIVNQVGSSSDKPYQSLWDISWLPDQETPISISAMVNYQTGLSYFAEPIKLELKRESYSVELCKPANQPQKWLTRSGEHSEDVFINSDINKVMAAKMVFTTWSPGYFNGIYMNDFLVFEREGPRYAFMQHDIPISYLDALQQGKNIIRTGKTPLHHDQMVHGVEVLWPGIMLLVKSKKY